MQGKKIHPIYKIGYLESLSYLIGFKDNQKEKQTKTNNISLKWLIVH